MKTTKAVTALLILALAMSMSAQDTKPMKFIFDAYQRIDTRKDSDRYEEKDLQDGNTLLIIADETVKLSGKIKFDLMIVEPFKEVETKKAEGITESKKYTCRIVDMADGEQGVVELWHVIESEAGEFWGGYLYFPYDTEMYYQFTGRALQ